MYTWTTLAQAKELKEGKPLLSRTRNVRGKASQFDEALENLAKQGEPFARFFTQPGQRRRRFGWLNPWATRQSFAGGEYGDQLVAMDLRKEAIIAIFSPGPNIAPFRFMDTSGKPVARKEAHRLGVVLHTHELRFIGIRKKTFELREVVICNSNMVEAYHVNPTGTEKMLAEAYAHFGLLERALKATPSLSSQTSLAPQMLRPGVLNWPFFRAVTAASPLNELYASGLAFTNKPVYLQLENLKALRQKLSEPVADLRHSARLSAPSREKVGKVGPPPSRAACQSPWCGYIYPRRRWRRPPIDV